MEIITPSQCRAARALLNWSQPELAARSDMHKQTISNFEAGKSTPSRTSLEKLAKTLENGGVVFTEEGGVNPNTSDIIVYEGRKGFESFMNDVYETAKKYGGDIYLFNSRPRLWYEWLGKDWYEMHNKRMQALGDKISGRITVQEGDDFLIAGFAEHKWFPQRLSESKIFYAYGPKLAFLDFDKDSLRISVVHQKDFSDIFRTLYDIVWEKFAVDIPPDKNKIT